MEIWFKLTGEEYQLLRSKPLFYSAVYNYLCSVRHNRQEELFQLKSKTFVTKFNLTPGEKNNVLSYFKEVGLIKTIDKKSSGNLYYLPYQSKSNPLTVHDFVGINKYLNNR